MEKIIKKFPTCLTNRFISSIFCMIDEKRNRNIEVNIMFFIKKKDFGCNGKGVKQNAINSMMISKKIGKKTLKLFTKD